MHGHIHRESSENSFAVRLPSDFGCYHKVNENCSVTSSIQLKKQKLVFFY